MGLEGIKGKLVRQMTDRDYILGTHDVELERLGLQHAVWRPRALAAWRRAGFTRGQRILDLGCGPGYASLDLADVVGRQGAVVAVDASQRFLQSLRDAAARRGVDWIETAEVDLDSAPLDIEPVDGVWARWIFAFVRDPQRLTGEVARCVRPGGRFVLHEYFDWERWSFLPAIAEHAAFVDATVRSWRDSGGEPNVGRDLPMWLVSAGFEVESIRPIVDVVLPNDFIWQWPVRFMETHTHRLVEIGYLTETQAMEIRAAVAAAEARADTYLLTPAVLEIIAVRR